MRRSLLFLPCIFFSFWSFCQSAGKLFVDAAVIKLQHAKVYTLAVAEAMPECKYDFKPTAEEMNFAEQLLHLAYILDWHTSTYILDETNPFETPAGNYKKEDVIATVTEAYDYALNTLTHFDISHLTDTVQFLFGPLSKLQIMNLMNDHQTHHRAQMLVYLRLNGIKPPDYVGW
jgi:uncharacterized damage-inducible protein DinB